MRMRVRPPGRRRLECKGMEETWFILGSVLSLV